MSFTEQLAQNEQEKIKFVSMIDNKPIFPNYLDLVPMKNFTRKEQEAQRTQQKESIQQKDEKDNKQAGMSSLNFSKMLATDLQEKYKEKQKILEDYEKRMTHELEQNVRARRKAIMGVTAEEIA